MASYSSKIKDLFRKYGKVGVAVHLTIYASTLAGQPHQVSRLIPAQAREQGVC